jgi:hypothetical protein
MTANKLFRRALIGVLILAVVLLGSLAVGAWRDQQLAGKPRLGLITTLPLRWGEGGSNNIIDPAAEPLPAYLSLQLEHQIKLIDAVDTKTLKDTHVLLLAQPRAFAPSEFAVLDKWVRDGGRILILADPALAWESIHPLGDKRRPLFTSLMSPLFAHWGIDLVLPMEEGSEKTILRQVSGLSVRTVTPGAWQPREGAKTAQCAIDNQGLTAQCIVGKGRAILIADADLLDADLWQGTGMRAISREDDFGNMAMIKQYLRQLTGRAAHSE